jgi:hypothetical protein
MSTGAFVVVKADHFQNEAWPEIRCGLDMIQCPRFPFFPRNLPEEGSMGETSSPSLFMSRDLLECGIGRLLGTAYSDPSRAFVSKRKRPIPVIGVGELVIWIFNLTILERLSLLKITLGILLFLILLGCSSFIS